MDKVKEGIQQAFHARNDMTLAVSTSGYGRMAASTPSLTEPRNVALTAVHSIWGPRAADMVH